jgi:hypothetical protein
VLKIVKESLIEGVADKHIEQRFAIPQEFDEFERKFDLSQVERNKVIQINEKANVIKNPTSLKNVAPGVRGIIDEYGNVYLSLRNNCIHQTILEALEKMGIVTLEQYWSHKPPTNFISIQRVKDTDILAMGESNLLLYDDKVTPEIKEAYFPILWAAHTKNPQLNIVFKLIGTFLDAQNIPDVSKIR